MIRPCDPIPGTVSLHIEINVVYNNAAVPSLSSRASSGKPEGRGFLSSFYTPFYLLSLVATGQMWEII